MNHFYSPKRIWLALLLLSIAAGGARAQWRIVAPNLANFDTLAGVNYQFGAMCFRDGNLWIANVPYLFRSTDSGITWTRQNLDQPYNTEDACELDFFDTANGLLIMRTGVFVTNNSGASWTQIKSARGFGGCFMDSPNHIAFTGDIVPGAITTEGGITTDRGVTWNDGPLIEDGTSAKYKAGTAYIFGGDTTGGRIYTSKDNGASWQKSASSIHFDCWSFAIDSCDPNRMYVVNEENAAVEDQASTDNHAHFFVTTDLGTTWQSTFSTSIPPWFFTGSIAEGIHSLYCQTVSDGVFRSIDRGLTWISIGGPSMDYNYDRRLITAINDNIVLAVDGEGNVWRTDNSGGDSIALPQSSSPNNALFIPSPNSIVNQSLCTTQIDTSIPVGIFGCGTLTGTLDSLWLTGSSAFQIADSRTDPRTIGILDSILVNYDGTQGSDTSILHLQYNIGSGVQDTAIQLIGSAAFASRSAQLHREAASAYFGQVDSLTLGVDLSSQINIDSLWPFITDIQFTFTWDSSVVSEDDYVPPSGWKLTSLTGNGNSESIEIQNKSSVATQPLNLGTALFLPDSTQLATGWVELPSLVIDIGSQPLSLCVTDNEDNHWSVKTLGVMSGVTEVPVITQDISVYPNPAEDELFVRNANEFPLSIEMYDAIGREVLSATGASSSTTTLATQSLQNGVYFFRATNGTGFSSSSKIVIVR